jgi:thiamine-monophosphate kinase
VAIAGGDVTRAGALTVSFTVTGWCEDPGELVARDGARAGDLVVVTGVLGGAGAGLAVLDGRAEPPQPEALRRRYALPEPRLQEGRALARAGASAMIDLSDGIATDAAHLAVASSVAIELSLASLPIQPGVDEVAAAIGEDARELAATAGEDYELCACVPPGSLHVLAPVGVTVVGRVLEGSAGVRFTDASRRLSGYAHSF